MIAAPPPAAIAADAGELELARVAAEWFQAVERLSRRDPGAAERLYSAAWSHLAQARPETPCSLSDRLPSPEGVR